MRSGMAQMTAENQRFEWNTSLHFDYTGVIHCTVSGFNLLTYFRSSPSSSTTSDRSPSSWSSSRTISCWPASSWPPPARGWWRCWREGRPCCPAPSPGARSTPSSGTGRARASPSTRLYLLQIQLLLTNAPQVWWATRRLQPLVWRTSCWLWKGN